MSAELRAAESILHRSISVDDSKHENGETGA